MDHQSFRVADVGEVARQAQRLDEFAARRAPALDAAADDRARSPRQQPLGEREIRVRFERRMEHPVHRLALGEEIEHGRGVLHVALHA